MEEYIHNIGTVEEFTGKYYGAFYHEPWVSLTIEDGGVNYNRRAAGRALRMDTLSAGTLYWKVTGAGDVPVDMARTISYSINGGEWVSVTSGPSPAGIPLAAGDVIAFSGDALYYAWSGETAGERAWNSFSGDSSLRVTVAGNAMSLLGPGDYAKATDIPADCALMGLFRDFTGLVGASGMLLPATGLTLGCYAYMFAGCSSLTGATPYLPATVMARSCYRSMYEGCSSLVSADVTPFPSGKVLAEKCFSTMFRGCSSLTDTMELPETTLADSCYASMYDSCSSLTGVTELPATHVPEAAYYRMFSGCTALVAPPALPATSLWNVSYQEMFAGCSSLLDAPELPATVLPTQCYLRMFQDCVSLTGAPRTITVTRGVRRPADDSNCHQMTGMFLGCVSLAVAPEIRLAGYPMPDIDDCLNSMFSGCSSLGEIKVNFIPGNLSTTSSGGNDCDHWVAGVAASGTFHLPESLRGQTFKRDDGHVPTGWAVDYYPD